MRINGSKIDECYKNPLWFSVDTYTELLFKSWRRPLGQFLTFLETETKNSSKLATFLCYTETHYTIFSPVEKNTTFCHDNDMSIGKWKFICYFLRIFESLSAIWNFIFSLEWTFFMELPSSSINGLLWISFLLKKLFIWIIFRIVRRSSEQIYTRYQLYMYFARCTYYQIVNLTSVQSVKVVQKYFG